MPKILKLGAQVVIASSVYIGISKVSGMESFTYIIQTGKEMLHRKKGE